MNRAYEVITDHILGLLEQGTIPWKRGWKGGRPMNINGRPYRGINVFTLLSCGYSSPHWLTFNQAKKMGGMIKKGQHGFPVVFWKLLERETGEIDLETRETIKKRVPMLRYYTVFNLSQVEGIDLKYEAKALVDANPIEAAEAIVNGIQFPPKLSHEGGRAFYRPSTDEIVLPEVESFFSMENYYSTRFHETVHWTGHESRLHRSGITDLAMFGDAEYSQEELVAEMGSAFLCGEAGISPIVIENQAAYIQGWSKKFRDDKKMVVMAAAQAQKAADFILKKEEEKA